MRNNQPVTGREYPFPEGKTVISYTNLKGQITRANDAFVELSGYAKDELIGQPHNLVRHPDMPPEAFRDLWDTLKKGRPWSGLVKNRRKDGDHYWVRAYASPLADGSGYVSVRVAASREEIDAAEQLYIQMNRDARISLDEGQVVSGNALARLFRRLNNISIAARLWLLTANGVAGFILAIAAIWYGLDTTTLTIIGALASIALLMQAWKVINKIRRCLNASRVAAETIAAGDLTKPLPLASKDELGDLNAALSVMRNNLHELIANVREGITSLNQSSGDVSVSANSSSKISQMQSEAASGMASAMEELSVSIDQVSEHADNAHRVSQLSSEKAVEGGRVIHSAATEMENIAQSVNHVAEKIHGLEEYSKQISGIAETIREIADQTNLLALNAAIEAARAGEQGRGFAVVADEVRKLAERTANSTKEISGMIVKIQDGTGEAVKEMGVSVTRVNEGVELARKAGDSVSSIREAAENAARDVDDITHAIQEQSLAARDIAQRIEKIAQGTEQNTLASSQTAASARQMADLSRNLDELAARFRIA
ncbi:aerotaxis receptor [Sideroxyarcus emersonii]|uniref:Aerotaxis receptor n=1 Tax=Sideroxyarcus emersonii TaxID=2764705 RepID=A0AAN1X9G0_9PROT|nr:PAS domain-containing methyl-accepting chemotaxis protein [Sideroxyarcus emersonii]BCK87032.1 aerotaxis receptor [Sideroxyarcus emersonii]